MGNVLFIGLINGVYSLMSGDIVDEWDYSFVDLINVIGDIVVFIGVI